MNGKEIQNGSAVNPPAEKCVLCEDGKYRWTYEKSLFKDPSIFLLICKVLFIPFLIIFIFVNLVSIGSGDFFPDGFLNNLKIFGIVFLVLAALTVVSFLIYAGIMGGKYIVDFEMDEKGINHIQTPSQAKKAVKLGKVTSLAGSYAGRPAFTGAGIGAQRTEMYSDFSKVRKVKFYPKRNTIKVNGLLNHNQVYTSPEDFSFVSDYIISHCTNLKK